MKSELLSTRPLVRALACAMPYAQFLVLWAAILFSICVIGRAADPLASWNDGAARQAILKFVSDVTRMDSSTFVAPAERIAVFDNDGTLWAEQPMYFQLAFALDRVRLLHRNGLNGRRRNRTPRGSRVT